MNSLDYTTIKVVGVVEPHTNGIHAYLRVIGYIDPDTGYWMEIQTSLSR